MRKNILIIALGLSLLNCQNSARGAAERDEDQTEDKNLAPTEIPSANGTNDKTLTATNSLVYLGTYKGTLPCADCQGIEISLELTEGFNYTLTSFYKGKTNRAIEKKGKFRWNKAENAIILENITDAPNQFLVGKNSLTQLDLAGKKVRGKLAANYVLSKLPESEAAKLDARNDATIAKQHLPQIIDTHWNLVEINGQPVKTDDPKGYFLELKADNNFKAYAGCNNMAGHYEYRLNRIRFMRVVGTMKFCTNANKEEDLKRVLETADNFTQEGKTLTFRSGEIVTAKFEAAK